MHEVLDELNSRPGVLGSLVATEDGIVVASRLGTTLDEDATAAMVSSVLAAGRAATASTGEMNRLVLVATRGKLIVTALGNAWLVVLTDRHIDFDQGLLDIEGAANSLRRLGRLRS